MKYKVGDKVRIKSLDWYNENKNNNREIKFENGIFTTLKSTFLGQIMTIEEITLEKQYILMEDRYKTLWTDEMIEGLVEEDNIGAGCPNYDIIDKRKTIRITEKDYQDKVEIYLGGYELKQEGEKWFAVKKKPKYPKTYEDCCKVLDFCGEYFFTTYEEGIHLPENNNIVKIHQILKSTSILTKLIICRNAYWKIAGDEMGLGKPWEPTHKDSVFSISRMHSKIVTECHLGGCCIFEFPTAEMRDAFKASDEISKLIEECKEFL